MTSVLNAGIGQFLETADNVRQIYALYPQVSKNFISISRDCLNWAEKKAKACKNPRKTGEIANFIRHLCWQANLVYWYGDDVARGIGDIHEGFIHPCVIDYPELHRLVFRKCCRSRAARKFPSFIHHHLSDSLVAADG